MTNRAVSPLRSRGYLPHLEQAGSTYFITLRLAGTVPRKLLQLWRSQRDEILRNAKMMKRSLGRSARLELRNLDLQLDRYLDRSLGRCWLSNPAVADMMMGALRHFNLQRYRLAAGCIMPNHLHAVVRPFVELPRLMHSWKSYSSGKANRILGRRGRFWQAEYFDRSILGLDECHYYIDYTIMNPVTAGLVKNWRYWKWTWVDEQFLPPGFIG